MTAQPPSDSDRTGFDRTGSDRNDRRDPLGFDEIVALLVAFAAIGGVLWWGFGRRAENWLGQLSGRVPAGRVTPASPAAPNIFGTSEAPVDSTSRITASPPTSGTPTVVGPAVPGVNPEVPAGRVAQPGVGGIPPGVAPAVIAPAVVPAPVAPAVPTTPPVAPTIPMAPADSTGTAVPTAPAVPTVPIVPAPIVVPQATPEAALNFPDLPETYWAYPFIAGLNQRGIITGFQDGTFRPDQPVTRAEYASLLSKVLTDAQRSQIPFVDVPADFWGTRAIDEAVKSGFLKGYPDSTFQPGQPISKMQVLLSLASGFQLPKPADPDLTLQAFRDAEQIPEWARPAVSAAAQSGVVVNYPNVDQFNPNQPATRGEVAAMLYQALLTTGQVQPIPSDFIARP